VEAIVAPKQTSNIWFDLPGLFIKYANKSAKSAALQGFSGRRYLSDAATSM
jgi:hypothetical protein